MRTQGDSQQDVLWLIDGKHDAGHWVMIAARTAEYLRTLAGGREVQVGQLAEFAVRAMLDKMSIRHRIVAQKLDNHHTLYIRDGTQFYWISSRVRPSDLGSQGLTWLWIYWVPATPVGTGPEQLHLLELAIDCHAAPDTTFGSNLNDFNMNMRKTSGNITVMVPACDTTTQTPEFPEICVAAQLACEPTRFGAH